MDVPEWKDKDEFDAWWKANVDALNRLTVTDPDEWERVTQKIEVFQVAHRGY